VHRAGLTDHEVGDIKGWSPQQVAEIRRVYVDQARVIVAIASGTGARCKTKYKTDLPAL
jgi:hypothetical protein